VNATDQPGKWSPGFIGIGAEKSATTWAWSMLDAHPAITMSQPKELNYFNHNFHRGMNWYRKHFGGAVRRDSDPVETSATGHERRRTRTGEISPHDMDCPHTAGRIADEYPDTKLLVMLRDPFDRALSHVMHDAQNAYGGVADVTAEQLARLAQQDDKYIRRSCYFAALAPYFEHFEQCRIGVFYFDDVKADPKSLVRRIYTFLNVDESFIPEGLTERINRTTNYRSPFAARMLQQVCAAARSFGPTNAALDVIYRRTALRERVMDLLMVDRGRPQIMPEEVFSADQISTIAADLNRLVRQHHIVVPETWNTGTRKIDTWKIDTAAVAAA